ncbi:MAG TPA: RICIN domain-containing protein [Pyrinomonadaceae bacterium]|nr:RICIN domain-containing protein [Pyrinomonadaceae bacterium]
MPRRKDLNNELSGQQRATLVNLMLQYIRDEVVDKHNAIEIFTPYPEWGFRKVIVNYRAYIGEMEQFLFSQGGGEFVPLPKWNPANEVPVEFRVMKPTRQDGTPWYPQDPSMPPVQNPGANPDRAFPNLLTYPNVCSVVRRDEWLAGYIFNWYSDVERDVGGIFYKFEVKPAVPLFWCWRAALDDVYYDWEGCPVVHPSLIHLLISMGSDMAADIKGASLSSGAELIQWHVSEGVNQQWRFVPLTGTDEGYHLIQSVNSGLVLDVRGGSASNKADVVQRVANDGDTQKWKLIRADGEPDDDRFYIQNKNSGMVMDVAGGSIAAGAKVLEWPLSGFPNQVWVIKGMIS